MTKRSDVSIVHNLFNDSARIDRSDLNLEQNRNIQTDSAIINNHFGSGVLPSTLQQNVLFDSDDLNATQAALLAAGNFDGTGLGAQAQPSDINLGNQLEIELTDSDVMGRSSIKVVIIGLSFDDTLQMDRFYFYRNGKQVTSKHYKQILTIMFNDFKGNNACSRSLGGKIVIKETVSFQLSTDPLMTAQDFEPDVFWRDFKRANLGISLFNTIQNGIGSEYSADGLEINVTGRPNRVLEAADVTSQIGQKFLATTNNIQKVTLLLSVGKDEEAAIEDIFDWAGDLVISIYPLQTSTVCPTDIVPELAIDFDPASVPLVQLSYNQSTLRDLGYVLNDVAQPVDFVFNATKIATPGNIIVGNYYVITAKRSGAANTGSINLSTGNDRLDDSRVTLFSGVWVDVPEEDLWFQIWTDAAKVADGQAYDAGTGIMISKTDTDDATGAVIDQQARYYSFSETGEGVTNIAVIQAILEESVTEQDERTGSLVSSRKQFIPSFSFVNESDLEDLKDVTDPLIIGAVEDTNPKQNALLEKTQTIPGLAKNDTFCIVNPDADLLSLNLLGSKLVPNIDGAKEYKIVKITFCTDGYGDLNLDGQIDAEDVVRMSELIGESIYFESTQQKIVDGYFDTLELLRADVDGDGYVTSDDLDILTNYVNKVTNSFPVGSSFTHMCLQVQSAIGRFDGYFDCTDGYVRIDGYGGLNIVDADSLSSSELEYDGYLITPQIDLDPLFTTVPFAGTTYQIQPLPFWQPYLLALNSDVRLVPAAFTSQEAIVLNECSTTISPCEDRNDATPTFDAGRNDFFVPDNLYIGNGELLRPNGDNYSIDFEMATIILQLPQVPLTESVINIFDKFVADRGDGKTRAGYAALKYSNCTTVQDEDLLLNRVRFAVAVQAFVSQLDGYSEEDGYGIIVDPIIGVHLDQTTGLLTLFLKDLAEDEVFLTLVTKIQITVYLKKAGWKNNTLVVTSNEIEGLISS